MKITYPGFFISHCLKVLTMNLDVDSPIKVSQQLRFAAEKYRESAIILFSQDPTTGRDWEIIADILDDAADSIEEEIR
jgi:hypothetical protein